MATVKKFEDLTVWQLSRVLYQKLEQIIQKNKQKIEYALINQIERSAGSVMDNIAEGFERGSRREFIQFLGYAKGSCGEVRSQSYRLLDKKIITTEEFQFIQNHCNHTSSLLSRLMTKLQQSTIPGSRHKQKPV
ncbi:MAG: four helix bundle protein [Chitinophagaceae bacterium]|nr:four helix bundle protein [Chitinophagaceae bacterium]